MKKALALALALAFTLGLRAQSDPVAIEVGGQQITASQFKAEFLKSLSPDERAASEGVCTYEKRKAIDEYAQLYANFRARLMDAYQKGIDSHFVVHYELSQYRKELCMPYLIDSASMERILREAYERNHYVVHASHILVRLKDGATPADTLEAYNKAMDIYRQAIAPGADFAELALQHSDDPSAKDDPLQQRVGNRGDLGNFTVFQMVYPFETAAYTLEPGQVSQPVRTRYGYHVIKLHNKTPYFGKTTLQHIWVSSKRPSAAADINNAYLELQEGQPFNRVARNYSEELGENAGFVANLDPNQLPPAFVEALSGLNEGDYTQPFQSPMGWHIIKLVKKENIPAYEDMVPLYKQRLTRDNRNRGPRTAFVEQYKQQHGFVDYTREPVATKGKKKGKLQYQASLAECAAAMTDTIYYKKWQFHDSTITDLRPLFRLRHREYNAVDFLRWLEGNQVLSRRKGNFEQYVQERYADFIEATTLAMADSLLEQDNAEFAKLYGEYRDGLVIFAYNDYNVWSKAIKDTIGLQQFYATESAKRSLDNPDDENYFWGTRAHVVVVDVSDAKALSIKKARKMIAKAQKQGVGVLGLSDMLNKATRGAVALSAEEQIVEQGNELLTSNEWREGLYERPNGQGYRLLLVDRIMEPQLKSLREARGYYINEYQNHLDAELIKELRQKYNVKVHQDVIDQITY